VGGGGQVEQKNEVAINGGVWHWAVLRKMAWVVADKGGS